MDPLCTPSTAWDRLATGGTLLLDAGVSTELQRRGAAMADDTWSARASIDAWEDLVALHQAYIEAGADIITANTYASSRLMLEPAGLGGQVEEINRRAVEAALAARERSQAPHVLVAGSLSHMHPIEPGGYRRPTGASAGAAAMVHAFGEAADVQTRSGVDLLLLEMMSVPERMGPMFEAVAGSRLPVWCGLSAARADDGTLRSWHRPEIAFDEVVDLAAAQDFPAMGVMHTSAELIGPALTVVRGAHRGPLLAYPDAGHLEMPHWHFVDDIAPERFARLAEEWRRAGAQVLGGCCGLGPEHIAALAGLKSLRLRGPGGRCP